MVAGRAVALLGLLVWSVLGCVNRAPLPPELRRAAATVKLIDGPPPPRRERFGAVQGLSCGSRQRNSEPDAGVARERLKVEAARLGGNAVASVVCREEATNQPADDCWRSIRCTGDALRLP
jgi:hypothetical protein